MLEVMYMQILCVPGLSNWPLLGKQFASAINFRLNLANLNT